MQKLRVLVVDDSASVRETLTRILESDPSIQVMATASDPFVAAKRIQEEIPDVITLDVEMPRMDGITFLRKINVQLAADPGRHVLVLDRGRLDDVDAGAGSRRGRCYPEATESTFRNSWKTPRSGSATR